MQQYIEDKKTFRSYASLKAAEGKEKSPYIGAPRKNDSEGKTKNEKFIKNSQRLIEKCLDTAIWKASKAQRERNKDTGKLFQSSLLVKESRCWVTYR